MNKHINKKNNNNNNHLRHTKFVSTVQNDHSIFVFIQYDDVSIARQLVDNIYGATTMKQQQQKYVINIQKKRDVRQRI